MVKLTTVAKRASLLGLGLSALGALGCQPTFEDRNSEVLGRRVLGVKVTPAQARPGATLRMQALVVEPGGTLKDQPVDWAFCNAPKPVAETNDVSAQCLAGSGEQFEDLGYRATGKGKMPDNACRLFGPDVPPSMAGQPSGRPTDPDSTGSFYQPLRVLARDEPAPIISVAQAGIVCGQPTLTGEQLLTFTKRARLNEHPLLENVLVDDDANQALTVDDGVTAPLSVTRGQTLRLRASWPVCPSSDKCGDGICGLDENPTDCAEDCTTPAGCHGAETYVYYDPLSRQLVDRREAMRVAWFSGAGSFGDDHTGRREDELDSFSDGAWTAPNVAGLAHLWVVLRDSRGGIDWQSYVVDVK